MPSYYTPSGSGGSSSSGYKPVGVGAGSGGISIGDPDKDAVVMGKGSIDLTDFGGSVAETVGSIGEFGSQFVGGVAGAVGGIGFGDGKNIGALADVPGNVLGAIGGVQLPYLGDDPNKTNATLGDVPGVLGEAISAPSRALERTYAGQRVEAAQRGDVMDFGAGLQTNTLLGGLATLTRLNPDDAAREAALPPDLQQRLEAGESVDVIADELVARGAGYTQNPVLNLVGQAVLDPLNFLAPGAGSAGQAIKRAGRMVQAGEDVAKLGLGPRVAGTAYNAVTRGMSAGGAAFVDKVVGPVTSGALHALGTGSFRRLSSGYRGLSRAYANAIDEAAGSANAQLINSVIADDIGDDIASRLDNVAAGLDEKIGAALTARRGYRPAELERRAQEKLQRVSPEFLGATADELTDFTTKAMAIVTDSSIEDAARVVGRRASVRDAKTAHWLRYGKAADELGRAKADAAALGKSNIDIDRMTLIAEDTLTTERAAAIAAAPPNDVYDLAMKYEVVANHFLGKHPENGEILGFIKKLADQGALHEAVRLPKSGKNKLPGPLSAFRAKWADNGYDLGFAPKDNMKVIMDADGNVLFRKPFVPLTSRHDPVTMRNPLGRFMDALFRGTTQTTIVQESRQRMTRYVAERGAPISPNQVRSIHKAILEEAADRHLTPRALVAEKTEGGTLYEAIFKRFLSDDEYRAMTTKFDPTFLVMHSFQGNWKTVGLTQYATGAVKAPHPSVATISEFLYPKARFTYRPSFQLQEMIESPTFNALRGIRPRDIPDDLAQAYRALAEQPEFRYLTMAEYLNLAGDRLLTKYVGTNTPIGRAMSFGSNIQLRKNEARIAQVLSEHGDEFREAVNAVNPRAWRAMEEAYSTTDPRAIADAFLKERLRIGAHENIDEAMAAIDAIGNPLAGPEGELVWQAFKDSFRKSSIRAFQTHFFNPQRGWLERTINHPYLGIYPLSYMWGKVLPEFSRFLLARPFGVAAPGLGFDHLARVQQAYLGALADDPEFSQFIADNGDAIYFAQMMFPGDPTNLTANAPAWLRHVGADISAGRSLDLDTVAREVEDTGSYALAGPVKDITSFSTAASDLIGSLDRVLANLDKAARQYDGQFPLSGTPLVP